MSNDIELISKMGIHIIKLSYFKIKISYNGSRISDDAKRMWRYNIPHRQNEQAMWVEGELSPEPDIRVLHEGEP